MKKVILALDLEEFDLPLEYGKIISFEKQIQITTQGMSLLKTFLEEEKIPTTIFCTGVYALANEKLVKDLSLKNEIASHSMNHTSFNRDSDLFESKKLLKKITGQEIHGFRMPRMTDVSAKDILEAGYRYNASMNPTFVPGRYNNFNKPKLPYTDNGILQIPSSVSPLFRIPLFWLSFKNLPISIYKKLFKNSLSAYGVVNIYFHPWEFANLSNYKDIPKYIRRLHGEELLERLRSFIAWIKTQNIEFTTFEKAYLKKVLSV